MAIRLPKKFQHLSENVLNMRANSKPNSVREGCSGANLRRRQLANGKTVREVIQCWIANGCGTSGRNGRPFSECRSPEDSAWGALRWEINNGRITLTESLSPSKAWIQAEEDAAAVNQSLESERRKDWFSSVWHDPCSLQASSRSPGFLSHGDEHPKDDRES